MLRKYHLFCIFLNNFCNIRNEFFTKIVVPLLALQIINPLWFSIVIPILKLRKLRHGAKEGNPNWMAQNPTGFPLLTLTKGGKFFIKYSPEQPDPGRYSTSWDPHIPTSPGSELKHNAQNAELPHDSATPRIGIYKENENKMFPFCFPKWKTKPTTREVYCSGTVKTNEKG